MKNQRREIVQRYFADYENSGFSKIPLRELINGVKHTEQVLADLDYDDLVSQAPDNPYTWGI